MPDNIYGKNATNVTNGDSSEDTIDLATSFSLIVAVAAVVGIATTVITIFYQRRQQRLTALKEAFEILNNREHRNAREMVCNAFKRYESGQKDIFETESVKPNAAMVRADLDQIGLLIHHNLIPKDIFLKAYWNTILICWKSLENDINYYRKKRDYLSYMQHFQELKQSAEIYWKKYHPETKEIKVY